VAGFGTVGAQIPFKNTTLDTLTGGWIAKLANFTQNLDFLAENL
jgi:hypothetical protein